MVLPNYKDGSIVNLMSSLIKGMGGKPAVYKSLPKKLLSTKKIEKSRTVVLLVLDGLGYEYIQKYGKGTVFSSFLVDKITSLFPTATGACIPAFATGVAPQQHGLTGWHVYLKELGVIGSPLAYVPRGFDSEISIPGDPEDLFVVPSMADKIKRKSYLLTHKQFSDSAFTKAHKGSATVRSYTSMRGFFQQLRKLVKDKKKKYVYAYWPMFDLICHSSGAGSLEAFAHFLMLHKYLAKFVESMKKSKTTIVITADHGMIDTDITKAIALDEHPKLKAMLSQPLCGEPRAPYCYVHADSVTAFEKYVKKHLSHACTLHKSKSLLKKGYFGLGEPHPNLRHRIGDYVLIMKENYVMKDALLTEGGHFHIGNHGGLHKDEMYVPLIVIDL